MNKYKVELTKKDLDLIISDLTERARLSLNIIFDRKTLINKLEGMRDEA